MSLPEPDFGYNSHRGWVARETRLDLEESHLGRPRTPEEEREYQRAARIEREEEFPEMED